MALPAKFRKVLSKDLVVTPRADGRVRVRVRDARLQRLGGEAVRSIGSASYKESDREHVKLRRVLEERGPATSRWTPRGASCSSPEARAAVGIDKDVVVAGNTGRVEIWDAKRFEQMDEEIDLGLLFD